MAMEDDADREKILIDVREVAELLGIRLTKAYELCARNELPVVRVGRLVKVHRPSLLALLEDQARASQRSVGR